MIYKHLCISYQISISISTDLSSLPNGLECITNKYETQIQDQYLYLRKSGNVILASIESNLVITVYRAFNYNMQNGPSGRHSDRKQIFFENNKYEAYTLIHSMVFFLT